VTLEKEIARFVALRLHCEAQVSFGAELQGKLERVIGYDSRPLGVCGHADGFYTICERYEVAGALLGGS
jgi:hypothetical protein